MSSTGKQLEQLVRAIEKLLLPKGFEVLGNERVFNDEGVQTAEFDIEIRGKVGSTSFKWLIECRDRPTEGPAPGSWIEQLVGRRSRFNFNKVTAVSTTAFAQGAIEYAQDEGIELRTVETLTAEHIAEWFLASHLHLFKQCGKMFHADLHVEENLDQKIKNAIENKIANADSNTPVFVSKKDGQVVSVSEAWRRAINPHPEVFNGIQPNEDPVIRTIQVHYPDDDDRYQFQTDVGATDILQIVFRAELSVIESSIPISKITQYRNIDKCELISQSVQFKLELENQSVDLSIHKLDQKDGTLLALQASPSKRKDC